MAPPMPRPGISPRANSTEYPGVPRCLSKTTSNSDEALGPAGGLSLDQKPKTRHSQKGFPVETQGQVRTSPVLELEEDTRARAITCTTGVHKQTGQARGFEASSCQVGGAFT